VLDVSRLLLQCTGAMFDQPNALYEPKFCHQAGIYRVDVGPKFYLGSTTRLGARHSSHRGEVGAGKHPNKALQAAWDEHQDFRFTVLTLIPAKDCDEGRDHVERLKFHEQILLDQLFADPGCCNASESSRYNTTISDVMKAKWLDPEYRVSALRKLRESREANPVGPETRAKMGAAKRGLRGPTSRPCVLNFVDGTSQFFESAADAARSTGVSQQAMHGWLSGKSSWPGHHRPSRHPKFVWLQGRFLTREEYAKFAPALEAPLQPIATDPPKPRPQGRQKSRKAPRPTHLDRGIKVVHCELEIDGAREAFCTIHAAAKRVGVTHLKMYLWLTGERPWPEGLTGRAITPL
jgi:hypothetical protein